MLFFRLLPVLCFALGGPVAALGADSRPLLEVHDRHTLAEGPASVAFVDQDLFVARDGTVVVVSVNRGLSVNEAFATTYANGQATPTQLAALNAAIAAAQAGQLSGVCQTGLFPLGSSYRFTLTWFGVLSRTSLLTVTDDGTATQGCPPAVADLLRAAMALQIAVLLDPHTTLKAPDCNGQFQCPGGLLCCYPCGIPGCQFRCSRPDSQGRCPQIP